MSAKQVSPARGTMRKSAKTARPVWRTFQKIHRRDLILLSGALSLACISVLAVMIVVLQYQTSSKESLSEVAGPVPLQPTHTIQFQQVTGLNQYAKARAAAQAWADDAQLVSANANWPRVLTLAQVGEPTLWTYRFHSPAKGRLLFVTVSPEGEVETIEHVAPITLPPGAFAADSWLIDSPTALALWLDYGGAKVLGNNPGLEIMIQLRSAKNSLNPVWMVIGLNNQTQEIHTVVIDANQGVVTSAEPGS